MGPVSPTPCVDVKEVFKERKDQSCSLGLKIARVAIPIFTALSAVASVVLASGGIFSIAIGLGVVSLISGIASLVLHLRTSNSKTAVTTMTEHESTESKTTKTIQKDIVSEGVRRK